jgi:hypothetical protein
MEEFELSHGPLPEWAIGRNWLHFLVPGAQLLTKDGRKVGNAHIVQVYSGHPDLQADTFYCLTDAGSEMTLTEREIRSLFHVGDWLSDPSLLTQRFTRI